MLVLPGATPDASPRAVIVAVAGTEDDQTTLPVASFVVLSLNVLVAVNCWVFPVAMERFAGVTAIETSVGAGGSWPGGGAVRLPPHPARTNANAAN